MKAPLRKDLVLGGGAGALLVAILVGATVSIGPLLGIDWNGGSGNGNGAPAVGLPAIPATTNPSADVLRQRAAAPRVVSRRNQPTTSDRRAAAPTTRPTTPTASGRRRQPTTAPKIFTPVPTQDAPSVAAPPAPAVVAPAVVAAGAIPVTPSVSAKAAKALKLRVASLAVGNNDSGTAELRLSLTIDHIAATPDAAADSAAGTAAAAGVAAAAAAVPEQVTVTLRPRLPDTPSAASGPLALRAHVDVVEAPTNDSGATASGSDQAPGMQVRVRMALEPAADSAPATTPTVADAGDGDGQSNVIALSVPLAAFSGEDAAQPIPADPSPAQPASGDIAPAGPTEIRLDLAPASDQTTRTETETATVPAPTAPATGENSADVPVTVVVDATPQPAADPAPAPQPDATPAAPAPAPAPTDSTPADTTPTDSTPADTTPTDSAPADTTPADTAPTDTTPPTTTPAYPSDDAAAPGSTVTAATTTATDAAPAPAAATPDASPGAGS